MTETEVESPGAADPAAGGPDDAALPPRRPLWLVSAVGLVVIAVVAWLSASPIAVLAVILVTVTVQIGAAVRHRNSRVLLVRAAWALPILGPIAAFYDPRAGALLMPAGLACLLLGLGLVHASTARERVGAALRGRTLPAEEPETSWRRDRASLVLIVPTIALAALLLPVATWSPGVPDFDPAAHAVPAPPSAAHGAEDRPQGLRGATGSRPADDGFPSRLRDDRGAWEPPPVDPYLARRVLIEVTPTQGHISTGDLGPIYLRRFALTGVDAHGVWTDDVPSALRVQDGEDGVVDGWCEFPPRPARADTIELAVHQIQLTHPESGWVFLHTFAGMRGVDRPDVRCVPDDTLLVRPTADATVDYRLSGVMPSRMPFPTDRTPVVVPDPRALAMPKGIRAIDALAAEAAFATANASTDLSRVRAVTRHLRESFTYRDVGDAPDPASALDSFVRERAGRCEQFAQAEVLMLRSLRIPARIAVGFLAIDWNDPRRCYIARGSDSHAWVEVSFRDCGWVVFEPTPVVPQNPRDAHRPAPDGDGLTVGDAGTESAGGTLPDNALDAMVRSMDDARGLFTGSVAEHPWLWAIAVLVAIALVVRSLRRRGERLSGRVVSGPADRTAWGRLLQALARRGHRRQPSQTALEFAAAVAAEDLARFARFPELTARQQAARFGGLPLTADDERAIEEFSRLLADGAR